MAKLLPVEEARACILAAVAPMEAVTVPLLDAQDHVLAEDVVSAVTVPPLANSSMDGFAVRAEDTVDAPVSLVVAGTVAAGYMYEGAVGPGQAVRIMTGAPLPPGADAVVRFEDTDAADDRVTIRVAVRPGNYVRPAGQDIRAGEVVVPRGTLLRPAHIGVLASVGQAQVSVIRRPRVGVLATGDELVPVGEPLQPGQIYNSNTYSMAAQVTAAGGIPVLLGIARDTKSDLTACFRRGLEAGVDLFITSGGVSMGDFDVVKDVLQAEGSMDFWRVNMKPGKPLAFGRLGSVPHLGLPGNPVSSMVAFQQFARPAILKMRGLTNLDSPTVDVILDEDVPALTLTPDLVRDERRQYVRVMVETRADGPHARLTGSQDSGVLTSMARANALVVVPEGEAGARAGEWATAQWIDWPAV
ncbi:MAG: molybdopterin molybdotransferase MoeA [Chloroflexi bacterium]|nr:molybdopterin molybdotransferase MoeA [Chloroflexota bacterium]